MADLYSDYALIILLSNSILLTITKKILHVMDIADNSRIF